MTEQKQEKKPMSKGLKMVLYGITIFVVLTIVITAIFGDSAEVREKKTISKLLQGGNVDSSLVLMENIEANSENYTWARFKIDSIQAVKDSTAAANFTAALKREIESIEKGNDLVDNYTSKDKLINVVLAFSVRAKFINEAKESDNPEDQKLGKRLEELTVKEQKLQFPKLRNAFYNFVKPELWEQDIKIKLLGDNFTTLDFTGSMFSLNKNISDSQKAMSETLRMYRFKRTQYRWSDIAREYTSYTIPSPDDDEIVEAKDM